MDARAPNDGETELSVTGLAVAVGRALPLVCDEEKEKGNTARAVMRARSAGGGARRAGDGWRSRRKAR